MKSANTYTSKNKRGGNVQKNVSDLLVPFGLMLAKESLESFLKNQKEVESLESKNKKISLDKSDKNKKISLGKSDKPAKKKSGGGGSCSSTSTEMSYGGGLNYKSKMNASALKKMHSSKAMMGNSHNKMGNSLAMKRMMGMSNMQSKTRQKKSDHDSSAFNGGGTKKNSMTTMSLQSMKKKLLRP